MSNKPDDYYDSNNRVKPDHVFALSHNFKNARYPKTDDSINMTELSAIEEARRRTTSGSPKTKPNAQIEVKARVDTNNRGGKL